MSDVDPLAQDLLARGLAELGEPASGSSVACLAQLAALVERWNQRLNLTGHADAAAIAERLVLDALALAASLPPFETLLDIGSGAGFPGLPIAIRYPDRRVTLLEARERRHHFQRAAVRELGLTNVVAVRGRAEECSPGEHDAVIAQAVARPDTALAWMLPWVRVGGLLVIPGAERPPQLAPSPQVSEGEVLSYTVPVSGRTRTAWLARKTAS